MADTGNRRNATWYFDGRSSPALDVATDETPPTHRGSIAIPGTTTDAGVVVNEHAEIVAFYFDQGLTAVDLLKMTAEDALARVPVGVLRARTVADVPQPEVGDVGAFGFPPSSAFRGTVSSIPGPARTVDNSAVPVEL